MNIQEPKMQSKGGRRQERGGNGRFVTKAAPMESLQSLHARLKAERVQLAAVLSGEGMFLILQGRPRAGKLEHLATHILEIATALD
jgi:hypothetical protein